MVGKIGVNIPWCRFDIDFGYSGERPPPWAPLIDKEFANLKAIGMEVVRWWLLCSGGNYPPMPSPQYRPDWPGWPNPRFYRPNYPPKIVGYDVGQPTRLSELFLNDFRLMLSSAAGAELQVIPCLMSFDFCFIGEGGTKGCRYEYLTNDVKRELFLSNVLQPLVEIVANESCPTKRGQVKFKDVVYAFEVMNEPEWCTDTMSPPAPGFRQSNVPYDKMIVFLQRGCQMINAVGLSSTVGYWGQTTMYHDTSVAASIPQFHIYPPHIGPIGPWSKDLAGLPVNGVIIGEIGLSAYYKSGSQPLSVGGSGGGRRATVAGSKTRRPNSPIRLSPCSGAFRGARRCKAMREDCLIGWRGGAAQLRASHPR